VVTTWTNPTPGTMLNAWANGTDGLNKILDLIKAGLNTLEIAMDAGDEATASAAAIGIAGVKELVIATEVDQRGLYIKGAVDTVVKHLIRVDDYQNAAIMWLANAGGLFLNDDLSLQRDISLSPQNWLDIYGNRITNGIAEYSYAGPPGNKLPYIDALQELYQGTRAGGAGSWTVVGGSAPAVVTGNGIAAVGSRNIVRLTAPTTSMTALTGVSVPAVAGQTYSSIIHSKAVATGRSPQAGIRFKDAGGATISTLLGSGTATNTSTWTKITSGGLTAPASTASAEVVASWPTTVASEQHYLSGCGLWDGTVTSWAPPAVAQPWSGHGQTVAGDRWWRSDTPSTALQRLYVCTTGGTPAQQVWAGIL